jgi:protein-S-isoprenylcysteine O-methyltransferase Ste14
LKTFRRRFADLLLFGVTSAELGVLLTQAADFSVADWIYVLQHVLVLGIAVRRPPPQFQDSSPLSVVSVVVAYAYSYAQVIYLDRFPGEEGWPWAGLVLVTFAAVLSLASLLTLGKHFGVRPALRGLVTTGPYRFVRHPMYLAYMIGDIGYNLQEWNRGTILLTLVGWASLLYRIHAEEQVIAKDSGWERYAAAVAYRLAPGVW